MNLDQFLEKEFFTIQDVAKITNRTTQTVRSWEKKGVILEADKRGDNNWRQYSRTRMAEVLEKILNHPWDRKVIKNVDEVEYVINVLRGKAPTKMEEVNEQ